MMKLFAGTLEQFFNVISLFSTPEDNQRLAGWWWSQEDSCGASLWSKTCSRRLPVNKKESGSCKGERMRLVKKIWPVDLQLQSPNPSQCHLLHIVPSGQPGFKQVCVFDAKEKVTWSAISSAASLLSSQAQGFGLRLYSYLDVREVVFLRPLNDLTRQ